MIELLSRIGRWLLGAIRSLLPWMGAFMLLLAVVLLPIALLMSIIQAVVFSLLASLYIMLDTEIAAAEAEHAA